jgi:hypothetical protein
MKHATAQALDQLEPLLADIRNLPSLKEKSRGVFYRGSRATLHFHEDPQGLFADLRTDARWRRLPVDTQAERVLLLRELGEAKPANGA